MEFEKIAELAYKEKDVDNLWDMPTKNAYLRLEKLYYKYKIGEIKKEDCIKEKAKIAREFEYCKNEYNRYMQIYQEYNQNKIDNTMDLVKLQKSQSIEEMLEYALKIVARCVKDDTLLDSNLEKIKNFTLN